jgi:hypothetical protein
MGKMTQDGFSFDSEWIEGRIAKFMDLNAPWAWRRVKLDREISDHKSAMEDMLTTMPHDLQARAHAKAYLLALEKALDDLNGEILKPHDR